MKIEGLTKNQDDSPKLKHTSLPNYATVCRIENKAHQFLYGCE